MEKWIGLLDCNNFFVSCERLFRPDLVGKPVVVLSSNDGCVVARSQEVKDIGVPMGVPYFKIKDTLEKAGTTVFSSHFALYRDISRRVFAVMREELDVVEQYSIDEAFFELKEQPLETSEHLKKTVELKVGIPVSIGIAHTKTQAKYANSMAKQGAGINILSKGEWLNLTPSIPLSAIWGVGGQMELRYKRLGLSTVGDFLALSNDRMSAVFGINGVRLQKELRGESVFRLEQKVASQKSIMSSRSFKDATLELAVLADSVAYHVRHAAADLRAMNMKTATVRVFIRPSRHGHFLLRGGSAEAVLPVPTNNSIALLKAANNLLKQLYEPGVPYKKAGVILSQLVSNDQEQGTLFDPDSNEDSQSLMSVIDTLNNREGREVLLLGSRLQTTGWQASAKSSSPAYTTRWSDVASVRA